MNTTYHLSSAQEIPKVMESIIATYKSKPITITVEEDTEEELTEEMKAVLDKRLMEDETEYITAGQSVQLLKQKYGL